MENKEYLNEETYQKSNQKVKKIGNILIIVGLVLLIGGFILTILGFLGFGRQITNGMKMVSGLIVDRACPHYLLAQS